MADKIIGVAIPAPDPQSVLSSIRRAEEMGVNAAWMTSGGDVGDALTVFAAAAAQTESEGALSSYWSALEGTLDPAKVAKAANNAVIGNATEVAAQMRERFHPDDRLMLWFDFFRHDSARICRDMRAFMDKVVPLVNGSETQ